MDLFALFERVSGEKQHRDGISLETQREMALELIEEMNGQLVDIYREGGVSAKKKRFHQRPEMMRLINDIQSGRVNHVIAYRRDRLLRNTQETLEFIQILLDNNCKISFTAREGGNIDLNEYRKNGGAKLMELILAQVAEMEVENTSLRVSDNMISKARAGQFSGGIAPYGYYSKDSTLIPIESEIDVIKEIEDLYLQGYGSYNIARFLNGIEVKGLGKRASAHKKLKQHKRAKETWTKDSIEGVLFNPIYSGVMTYYSYKNNQHESKMDEIKVKSDYVTPLRTEARQLEIDRLRRKKRENKTPPRHYTTPFLLSSILICGECGEKYISRSTSKKDGSVYAYYACKNVNATDEKRCKNKIYKKEVIENFVLSESKRYLQEFLDNDTYKMVQKEMSKSKNDIESQISSINDDIKKMTKQKDNLMVMLSDLDIEDVTYPIMKDNFTSKIRELLVEINEKETVRNELIVTLDSQENKEVDVDFIQKTASNFSKVIEHAPIPIQKQLIEELFSTITIDKLGNVNLTLSVDLVPADIERNVEFISIGGVGDSNPLKNKLVKFNEKVIDINVNSRYVQILDDVKNNLFSYMIHKNGGQKGLYSLMINNNILSPFNYNTIKNNTKSPMFNTILRIVNFFGDTIENFVDFINPPNKAFYIKMMEEVTNNKNEFSEAM